MLQDKCTLLSDVQMEQELQQTKHLGPKAHQLQADQPGMQKIPMMATPRKQQSLEAGLARAICAGTQYHCNNTLYTASKVAVLKEHLATEDQALLQSAGSISVAKSRSHWAT